MKKGLFFLLILFLPFYSVMAAEDFYRFDTEEQQQRFDALTSQLRCLVCQNQTLAESNAGLAEDLRKQVYQQVQRGQSDKQIVAYLVARYGDFILYRPPLSTATVGLWFGPLMILIAAVGYLIYYLRKNKQRRE